MLHIKHKTLLGRWVERAGKEEALPLISTDLISDNLNWYLVHVWSSCLNQILFGKKVDIYTFHHENLEMLAV